MSELEMQLQALEEVDKAEAAACAELRKAVTSKEFVALKLALQEAHEVAQGVSKELGRSSELLAHTLRRGEPEVSSKELARSKKLGASKVLRKSGEEGLSCAF